MSYLSAFVLEFENNIVIFEISTLDCLNKKFLCNNKNSLKYGTKMSYLAFFGSEF